MTEYKVNISIHVHSDNLNIIDIIMYSFDML